MVNAVIWTHINIKFSFNCCIRIKTRQRKKNRKHQRMVMGLGGRGDEVIEKADLL